MKTIPLTIVDNFFDNPDSVKKFSEKLEFFSPTPQFHPGKRTKCLSEIHPTFYNYVNKKVLRLFFEDVVDVRYKSSLYFQKIENYEGKGWIHQDDNLFTFMVYFHQPNPKINCGTSIWSLNSDLIHSINSNEEFYHSGKRRDHYKTGKVTNDYQEKFSNMDILNYVAVSSGSSDADFIKLQTILQYYNFKFICLDVANGYRDDFMDFIRKVRKTYPEKIIIAGNVVTPEGVKMILDAGANIVKLGIGNGSACATRMKTGIGYPQFSAILECQKIAHDKGGYILSDGGCKDPAEIVKAFGAGADFVMCGSLFAGTDETPGAVVHLPNGEIAKQYRGMASRNAQMDWRGKSTSPEGVSSYVPYKGSVEYILEDIIGGIKSGFSYSGARNLAELQHKVEWARQTSAGSRESGTHINERKIG